MRTLLLGLFVFAFLGCDRAPAPASSDAKPSPSEVASTPEASPASPSATPATAAPTEAATKTTTATPPAEPEVDAHATACQSACEHRRSCGIANADVTRCAEDCALLSDALTTEALAEYTKGDCAQVKEAESNFQTAALCRRACRHRSECLPEADAESCEAECAGLIMVTRQEPAGVLQPYIDAGCDTVKSEEAGFQMAGSCLRACGKVVECGVRDELPECIAECAQMIEKGQTNAENARALAGQSCDEVRTIVAPKPKPKPVRPPQALARSGNGCRSNGAQDCPYFSVCCRHSDYTRPGSGPGTCISPAICLMPTR